ncbi:transcriptional regulator LysR family [Vibrio variabilis]|uniref:Transcriptional regulator LysR family n=1 Tax=Vibrio variabilis TaxID=990271 RepID=A0ABQ0JKN8_9VIBR|nr:transcriptional regulator LysR family [Vibrio variabilis]
MHKERDYNLLKVLVLIYEYRSLTIAAAQLGKTESAVSKHLAKLREQLGDPLFVRRSDGLEPTHYLERVMPGIQRGLRSVETALKQGPIFDELSYDQPITVALDNMSIERFGSEILLALKSVFQNSMIHITTWRRDTYQSILDGSVQIGVQMFNEDCSKSLYQNSILNIEMGAIVGAQSDIHQWQDVFDYPCIHFEIRGWNETNHRLIRQMAEYDLVFDYQTKMDSLSLALKMVTQENTSVVLAKHLMTNQSEFRYVPFPEHMQTYAPLVTCIKQSNRQNPLHQKLHTIIKQAVLDAIA